VVIHTPQLQVLLLERADRPVLAIGHRARMRGETLLQTAQREVARKPG